MMMKCVVSALNLRSAASKDSTLLGELRFGDLFDADITRTNCDQPWIQGTVKSGLQAGTSAWLRRKYLVQAQVGVPSFPDLDRIPAARIIADRTLQFDQVTYKLPLDGDPKAKNWIELKVKMWADCSGWTYLLASEILKAYKCKSPPSALFTSSDSQIMKVGFATGMIVSGPDIVPAQHLRAGVLLGLDFKEYTWDVNRAYDIDHIVLVGQDQGGELFISQSSSSGGGVNRVPLDKWLASTEHLRATWKMHAVDLLMVP